MLLFDMGQSEVINDAMACAKNPMFHFLHFHDGCFYAVRAVRFRGSGPETGFAEADRSEQLSPDAA
jgi:hypothetical protein